MSTTQEPSKEELDAIADAYSYPIVSRYVYKLLKGSFSKEMTVEEASAFYDTSEPQLRNRITRNQIPCVKNSNGITVSNIDVNIYIHHGREFLDWLNEEPRGNTKYIRKETSGNKDISIELLSLENHIKECFIPAINNIISMFLGYALDKPVSLEKAANTIGITTNALRARAKRGTIPYYKIGGSIYLFFSEIVNHIRHYPDKTYL